MRTSKTAFVLIDCGRASKVTRGFPLTFYYELGFPPFIGTFNG